MNAVYDKAPAVLAWLKQSEAGIVLEDLAITRRQVFKDLQTATDLLSIGRLQGKMEVLNKVLDLPEKLKEYLKRMESERKGGV
jgi:hypothetical protein